MKRAIYIGTKLEKRDVFINYGMTGFASKRPDGSFTFIADGSHTIHQVAGGDIYFPEM
jgi:hypothetical protein